MRLVLTMLGVGLLGNLARWAVSPEQAGLALLPGALLLLPLLPVAALCLRQRHSGVRWGAGLGAALAAAFCNFVLLDPQYNQDANIGLGLYFLFGWIPVLGGAALLGGMLGRLVYLRAEPDPALPPLSWRGWGWPLLLPLFGWGVSLWAEWDLQGRIQEEWERYHIPAPDLSTLMVATLPALFLLLSVLLLPLTLLRTEAQKRGRAQPFLTCWWAAVALLTLANFMLSTWPKLP